MSIPVFCFCGFLHKWGPWSSPVPTVTGPEYQQRTCLNCNVIDRRWI